MLPLVKFYRYLKVKNIWGSKGLKWYKSFGMFVLQSNQFTFVYTVDMFTLWILIYYTFESTAFVLISCSVFELYIVSEARIQSIQIQIANIFENWVLFFHICYKTKILLISQTHQFWFYHSEWNLIRLKVSDGDIFSDHFHFLSVSF